MNFKYILFRFFRRITPAPIIRLMLKKHFVIKPGTETFNPDLAFTLYKNELDALGIDLSEKNILNFGYGGTLDLPCKFLDNGAGHVYVYDKFAKIDNDKVLELSSKYPDYFLQADNAIAPNPEFITVIRDDLKKTKNIKADIVLSSSVFEHINNIGPVIKTLTELTSPTGIHIHFIDLRDHFFKYPFEMLTFTEKTWNTFLNPGSNLNRLRLTDYLNAFEQYFKTINCRITESNVDLFRKIKDKIRPEFTTGDEKVDSAIKIVITASNPLIS